MKPFFKNWVALVAILFATAWFPAQKVEAAIVGTPDYDDTITAIFGTGNPDTDWVSATEGDVVTAVRFRERFTTNMPHDNAGTFSFALGTSVNIDFSLYSGSVPLSNLSFTLGVDDDPAFGVADYIPFFFDPIIAFGDNSYGNLATANGAGVEGNFILSANNTLAQNSQQLSLFGINTSVPGEYEVIVSSYTKGSTPRLITQAEAKVVLGPRQVPEFGGTLLLSVIALCGTLLTAGRRNPA